MAPLDNAFEAIWINSIEKENEINGNDYRKVLQKCNFIQFLDLLP